MNRAASIAAAEAATVKIGRHRARALEILERPACVGSFAFIDREAVGRDLTDARAELGAALTLLGSTDWPTPTPTARRKEAA